MHRHFSPIHRIACLAIFSSLLISAAAAQQRPQLTMEWAYGKAGASVARVPRTALAEGRLRHLLQRAPAGGGAQLRALRSGDRQAASDAEQREGDWPRSSRCCQTRRARARLAGGVRRHRLQSRLPVRRRCLPARSAERDLHARDLDSGRREGRALLARRQQAGLRPRQRSLRLRHRAEERIAPDEGWLGKHPERHAHLGVLGRNFRARRHRLTGGRRIRSPSPTCRPTSPAFP